MDRVTQYLHQSLNRDQLLEGVEVFLATTTRTFDEHQSIRGESTDGAKDMVIDLVHLLT